jgi:hypothetical protein
MTETGDTVRCALKSKKYLEIEKEQSNRSTLGVKPALFWVITQRVGSVITQKMAFLGYVAAEA